MKLSAIPEDVVCRYIRLTDDDAEEKALIPGIMETAKAYILGYTGLTEEEADKIEDFQYAFLCLCSDMYNTRDMCVQQDKLNPIAMCILDMHRANCIG
ncbi:MAG: head-tail connector protein [Oscillospiraceae bacterium]